MLARSCWRRLSSASFLFVVPKVSSPIQEAGQACEISIESSETYPDRSMYCLRHGWCQNRDLLSKTLGCDMFQPAKGMRATGLFFAHCTRPNWSLSVKCEKGDYMAENTKTVRQWLTATTEPENWQTMWPMTPCTLATRLPIVCEENVFCFKQH